MRTNTRHLHRIAGDIDRAGVAANETAIATVVEHARAAGIEPVLLTVLSDLTQPEVARARAFGKVATALASARAAHDAPATSRTLAVVA